MQRKILMLPLDLDIINSYNNVWVDTAAKVLINPHIFCIKKGYQHNVPLICMMVLHGNSVIEHENFLTVYTLPTGYRRPTVCPLSLPD